MRFVSFFAGIGGIDLGLERAGHECVGQVEIDDYCRRVLAKHWPDVWRHDDIRTLDPADIPEAELWTGGFPCQDISNAGKRAGIHGEQSGLFFDLVRLVREVRPGYILLENVAALLAAGRGMAGVLGELAESRYDAEWDSLPACAFGAPHPRYRVFIVAHPAESGWPGVYVPVRSRGQGQAAPDVAWLGAIAADADGERLEDDQRECAASEAYRRPQHRTITGRPGSWWSTEPDVVRVVHGVPGGLDRVRALGNAVVPQVAEYIGRLLTEK